MTTETKQFIALITVMLLAISFFFFSVFYEGKILSPAGLAYYYPPWSTLDLHAADTKTNLILSDQFDSILPQIFYLKTKLSEGVIPFYTDRIQNGTPFYLVIKHNLMSLPLILLLYVFSPATTFSCYIILQMLLGGAFLYLLLKSYKLNNTAAVLATVVFMFNSYSIQICGFQMFLQYCLLPVCFYALEKLLTGKPTLALLGYPLTVHMLLTAGYPIVTLFCYYMIGCYVLWRLFSNDYPLKSLLTIGSLTLAGVMLSSPALTATYDFFSAYDWSHRSNYWQESLPLKNLITYFIPFFYGPPSSPVTSFNWHNTALYFGVAPLLIVLGGLPVFFRNHNKQSHFVTSGVEGFIWLFTLWLIVVCYNVGNFLEHVYQFIPVFNSSSPGHQRHLLAFCLVLLTGFCADRLFKQREIDEMPRLTPQLASVVCLISSIILLVYFAFSFYQNRVMTSDVIEHLKVQLPIIIISLIVVLTAILSRTHYKTHTFYLLILLTYFDLRANLHNYNPTLSRDKVYPETPAISFLKKNIGNNKLLPIETSLLANTNLSFDLRTIAGRGFFDLPTQLLYQTINRNAFVEHKTQFLFPADLSTNLSSQTLDALGVKYIVAPPGFLIGNRTMSPGATDKQISVYSQKEWNQQLVLSFGASLQQTFTPTRTLHINSVAFRLHTKHLLSETSAILHLKQGLDDFTATTKLEQSGWQPLEFKFPPLTLDAYQPVTLELSLLGSKVDSESGLEISAAVGIDVMKGGEAILNSQPINGDITFTLYAENPFRDKNHEIEQLNRPNEFLLIMDDGVSIFENLNVFPRAWFVERLSKSSDIDTTERMMMNRADLRNTAWSDNDAVLATAANLLRPDSNATVTKELVFTENELSFSVNAPTGGVLIVGDNYDRNWKVYVDNQATQIYRVNLNMRAVIVPPMSSNVRFVYAPPHLSIALIISLLALLSTVGATLISYKRKLTHFLNG